VALACVAVARPALADCVFTTRPASAQEKKIYADGFALLQKMAPPAPAGWEQDDSPKDDVLTEVCAPGSAPVTRWAFSRSYSRTSDERARQDAALQQTMAIAQKSAATMKANEARLAEVQKQMEALMKRMQELAAAQRFAEMEKVSSEMETLIQQQEKLMGVAESDAAMKAVEAAADKDISANFSVTVGETEIETRAYEPWTSPVGRGYRQDFVGDNGNPHSDLVIVLPAAPGGGPGQIVVRISGDPARAEGLFKAARLR
jgi:hypothetical protein